jgi:hypothetical protein
MVYMEYIFLFCNVPMDVYLYLSTYISQVSDTAFFVTRNCWVGVAIITSIGVRS